MSSKPHAALVKTGNAWLAETSYLEETCFGSFPATSRGQYVQAHVAYAAWVAYGSRRRGKSCKNSSALLEIPLQPQTHCCSTPARLLACSRSTEKAPLFAATLLGCLPTHPGKLERLQTPNGPTVGSDAQIFSSVASCNFSKKTGGIDCSALLAPPSHRGTLARACT
mmetsp:Transcript_23128/g.37950  ORF Transcript_23128/g.37950 Transcript_23128/m.37950 type:complete len:167 (+) Transcript_23128:169-669(+)